MRAKKLKILLFGNEVLRQVAKPVNVFHYKLHSIIDSMAETLYSEEIGAALAANQVGILKRIIVIDYEGEYLELVNPEILESSSEQIDSEGCLSYPGYVGMVNRKEKIIVKYSDRNGKERIIEREGNMARCLQHEIDHLDGILFIDRMVEDFLTHSKTKETISLAEVKKLSEPGFSGLND